MFEIRPADPPIKAGNAGNIPEVIEQTLLFLHRNTTATTFHVRSNKPENLELGLLAA